MNAPEQMSMRQRVDAELATLAKPSDRDPRETLAAAARILAAEGHFAGLAGQISLCDNDARNRFWTLPIGVGFDEATAERFLLVDDDLNVLAGQGVPNPATRFHLWVYRARPDVRCITHTHPPAASALSTLARPLVVAHMDVTMLHGRCAFLPRWPGLPIGDSEGEIISAALGPTHKAILLAHHGILTAGVTIEEATYLAVYLEHAAAMQLRAQAAGEMTPVEPQLAAEAGQFLLKPEIVQITFDYWERRLAR